MDSDRIKGKADDVAGRVKRQVGEWTDNPDLQSEGAAEQVKGKVQNAWGKAKDAVRDANKNPDPDVQPENPPRKNRDVA